MKRDIWKQLKKQNDGRQLNLEVSDQKYIDKVTAYAVNQGIGMMETEIIRKDLIGMGFEAKKEGKLLEQRLGDVGEFARELVDAGKAENRKEDGRCRGICKRAGRCRKSGKQERGEILFYTIHRICVSVCRCFDVFYVYDKSGLEYAGRQCI